jgi:hypothetical protein
MADELLDMVEALQLPELITTPSRYTFDSIEALGLTFARFRTPGPRMYKHRPKCLSAN